MKSKILSFSLIACCLTTHLLAKTPAADTSAPKLKKFYVGSGMDAAIFSTAFIKTPTSNETGTLRFSYVLNLGVTFNYNINNHIGIYAGVDIKNVGFIYKSAGTTDKMRTYNLGVPIGIKIGDMTPRKMYAFLGGGVDLPLHYKEKIFKERKNKTKTTEWFSDRVPAVMPYVFAGLAINRGATFKLQYYPGNFLNSDYTTTTSAGVAIKPYANTEVHLLMLSIGFAVPLHTGKDIMKKKVEELDTNK